MSDVGPDALAAVLGIAMGNRELFVTALTHSSFVNEQAAPMADNERLEFLGDAVIGHIVGERVFLALPEASEGELTRVRASIVCQSSLAEFARSVGLGDHLRLGRGEDTGGGRTRPALLCAGFEAVIGALYLDAGIAECARVMERFVGPELERMALGDRGKDARSEFQELVQARRRVTPHYVVASQLGPAHAKRFVVEVRIGQQVVGRGEGDSKGEAAQAAARTALDTVEDGAEDVLGAGDDPGAGLDRDTADPAKAQRSE